MIIPHSGFSGRQYRHSSPTITIIGTTNLFVNGGTTASPIYYPNSTGVLFDFDLRDDSNDGEYPA